MKLTKRKLKQLIKEELKAVLGLNELRRDVRFGFADCNYSRKYKKLMQTLSKEQWKMSGHTRAGQLYGDGGWVLRFMAEDAGSYALIINSVASGYEKYKGHVIMVSNCSREVLS